VLVDPVDAGSYRVYADIPSSLNYAGENNVVIDTLVITKATPTLDLLVYADSISGEHHEVYRETGVKQFPLDVQAGVAGLGVPELLFNGVSGTQPDTVGVYALSIAFSEGDNYESATLPVGLYVIDPRELVASDFSIVYVDSVYGSAELGVEVSGPVPVSLSYHRIIDDVTLEEPVSPSVSSSVSPVEVGLYEVRITTTGNVNYVNVSDLFIGTYEIHRALISADMFVFSVSSPALYDGLPKGISKGISIGSVNDLITLDSVTLHYVDTAGAKLLGEPVDAGSYIVLADVVGVPNHRDTFGLKLGTFEISRAPLVSGIFSTSADTLVYTGFAQGVDIDTADWAVGVGEIVEVFYSE
jgi:hypothetical protein